MGFAVRMPGGAPGPALEGLPSVAAAVRAREAAWAGAWGGQALVLVDEATGAVVRPCTSCRGQGTVSEIFDTGADRGAAPAPCETCGGSGRWPDAER